MLYPKLVNIGDSLIGVEWREEITKTILSNPALTLVCVCIGRQKLSGAVALIQEGARQCDLGCGK